LCADRKIQRTDNGKMRSQEGMHQIRILASLGHKLEEETCMLEN